MQHRERDFDARFLFGLMDVYGNAATVVHDRDRVVGMDRDRDVGREACECLVHRVVDDFVDEMVQTARRHRPMYIAGRRRTASRPFRTWIESA